MRLLRGRDRRCSMNTTTASNWARPPSCHRARRNPHLHRVDDHEGTTVAEGWRPTDRRGRTARAHHQTPRHAAILRAADADRLVVTLENHTIVGGLAESVAATLAFAGRAGLAPIALPDEFLAAGALPTLHDRTDCPPTRFERRQNIVRFGGLGQCLYGTQMQRIDGSRVIPKRVNGSTAWPGKLFSSLELTTRAMAFFSVIPRPPIELR